MATKTAFIEGMSCGHCINRVHESIMSLPGVHNVKVSISEKTAVIDFEDGSLADKDIVEAIERHSFDVTEIR